MKKQVIILGGGGHAKVVLDVLEQVGGLDIVGFIAQGANPPALLGYQNLGSDTVLRHLRTRGVRAAFIAIGDNRVRKLKMELLEAEGFELISAISPLALISPYAEIGRGVAVMPGAVLNAGAIAGDGVIVNTHASVDHDTVLNKYVHVGPGATLAGGVLLGEGCFLGAGSTVIPNVSVGAWTTVGAAACVIDSLPPGVVAVGVPARVLHRAAQATGD